MNANTMHPEIAAEHAEYARLLDVATGRGGFATGAYLVAHPREFKDFDADTPSQPTRKLLERRALARFGALPQLVLALKRSGLFRQQRIIRGADGHPFLAWAESDVDGRGNSLDTFMRDTWEPAAVHGWSVVLMDRMRDSGPTMADASPMVLRRYDAPAVTDYLVAGNGELQGLQLIEPLPRDSFDQAVTATRHLVYQVTAQGARKFVTGPSEEPAEVGLVDHGFGTLPAAVLYTHRRPLHPLFGQSVLGPSSNWRDLFNLTSELRELLRKQVFSVLNIPLGTAAEGGPATAVEVAQSLIGQTTGTSSVVFSTQPASFISPDAENPRIYLEVIAALTREIFRVCAIPYDSDGRDAESAESRRLKRADFEATLAEYADFLEQAEYRLAECWFRGTYGPERWQVEWDKARIEIRYPREFEVEDFGEVIEQATAALALPVGESRTFRTEHSARMVAKFLPGASEDVLTAIRTEVAALPTPDEQREARFDDINARLSARLPAARPAAEQETVS